MAAMRLLILCVGLLCATMTPAHAQRPEAPFAPIAGVPDYVATMRKRDGDIVTIAHHSDWTRVDIDAGPRRATGYFLSDGPTAIEIYRNDAGEVVSAHLLRGQEPGSYQPRNTGERQTLAAGTCTVWSVRLPTTLTQLSCVTDDGIELSRKSVPYLENVAGEVTRIERRPVAADDVRPPREILQWRWWQPDEPLPGGPAGSDYETVLRDADGAIRVTRHHPPWTYVDESSDGVRRSLVVTSTRASFGFSRAYGGSQMMLALARTPPKPTPVWPFQGIAALNRSERILGETCDWFDMIPGATDVNLTQCRTRDGIVLKEESGVWGSHRALVAVKVLRQAIDVRDLTPPAELLDPKYWGLD
jgi:hypothetical protein